MNIDLKKQIEELEKAIIHGEIHAVRHHLRGRLKELKRFEKLIEELKKKLYEADDNTDRWKISIEVIDKLFYSEED